MVKAPTSTKKKSAAAGKENAPSGKAPAAAATPAAAPVDRYAELEKKQSAFAALSTEAKERAAVAPPLKADAVPVGMRRTDKKNRARYSDGIAAEPVALHSNGKAAAAAVKKEDKQASPAAKQKEASIAELKAQLAKKAGTGKKADKASPEKKEKKSEKRKRVDDEDDEEENGADASFIQRRMQQMANAAMEREIRDKKSKAKRARESTPSDDEAVVANGGGCPPHPLAMVPFGGRVATPHPASKMRRLASGVLVEKPKAPTFDVEEVPYTVEEPSEDGSVQGRGRLSKKQRRYASQDFAELEREMAAAGDAYDEAEDDDFESMTGDEDEEELTDEELDEDEEEEDDMSGEEEMEDEEVDDEDGEDEELTDEELLSSEIDEDEAAIRPEDVLRTIHFDDDDDQEEPEDEDDEDEEEEVEMDDEDEDEEEEGDECCDDANGGCCDENGDCCAEEDGSEMDDEDEEEGEDEDGSFTSDSSSHVSDDSYAEAFVDDHMAAKAVTIARDASAVATGKKGKKGGKAAAAGGAPIDFTAFPFKNPDSTVSAFKALDWLLSCCDVQSFFDDYFQSTSLVIQRRDPAYYGNLFSTGAMTAALREHCLEYGVNVNVALYSDGVRTTHNGTGRAYPLAIGDAIRSGCSVQLTNPQAFSREIWYLCDVLQEAFHCFVGANTYLTPAGASGFAPHWDEIDAFLLQVEGRKYWRVWAPESPEAELPLESSGNFTEADMAGRKPAFEGWIEQGDLLYIPRGFIHQARTDATVHSLHVTVSVGRQWTYANLLKKLLPDALEAFTCGRTKLRRQLPPGMLDMTGVAELPANYPAEDAGERLLNELDRHMSKFRAAVADMRESGVDLMAREFMRTALPPALTPEEKQLSAWGNDGADLFNEKGASRITPACSVRFIRRHGQRLLFESAEAPFVAHRMANARVYEGAEERTFPLTLEEEPAFCDLLSEYPDYMKVAELKMKKKAKIAFLTKLFNNGLIMVKSG